MIGSKPDPAALRRSGSARAPKREPLAIIRRNGPIPYWAQLSEILRDQIARGRWRPGDALPAEAELGETYGLSRTVVRQALNELSAEGLVQKEKGRGTFVSRPKIAELVVQEMRGFLDEMRAHGHTVGSRILRQDVIEVPPLVAPELGIGTKSKVVRLTRVRDVDGEPIVKVDSYLPASRFARLAGLDLSEQSLYAVLASEFGVEPSGGRRRIEATVASRELADALGVSVGSPILTLTAVSVDRDGTPFEYFRAAYRGDRTGFEVHVEPSRRPS